MPATWRTPGLPALLRDAQVLPIWEGTTNVLALDTLRAIGGGEALDALLRDLEVRAASGHSTPALQGPRVRADGRGRPRGGLAARPGRRRTTRRWSRPGRAPSPSPSAGPTPWRWWWSTPSGCSTTRGNRRGVAVARRLAASGLDALDTVDAPADARQVAFPETR